MTTLTPSTICRRMLFVTACSTMLVGAVGCHQGNLYQAGRLPPEFIAPRLASLRNVDLSWLATSIGDSNVLYPGDVVEITVATGLEEKEPVTSKVRVSEDGTVNVPLVGAVYVAGLQFTQAEQVIRAESIRRGKFVDPNVSVILDKRRTNRITVVGAVDKPGTFEVPASSSDVLSALVMAGGFTKDAGTIVEVRHPPTPAIAGAAGPQFGQDMPAGGSSEFASYRNTPPHAAGPRTVRIDLEQPQANRGADVRLEDGSTVMVMKRGKQFIHVIGLVKKADQFEMPEDQELRLLDAIALAGGRTLEIADKVHIMRQVPNRPEPVVIEASIRAAKRDGTSNLRLAAGDVVSVEETPTTFVIGTIREFVRFGISGAIPLF